MALTDLQKAALLAQIKDPQPPLGPSFGVAQQWRPDGLVGPPAPAFPDVAALADYAQRPQQAIYGAMVGAQEGGTRRGLGALDPTMDRTAGFQRAIEAARQGLAGERQFSVDQARTALFPGRAPDRLNDAMLNAYLALALDPASYGPGGGKNLPGKAPIKWEPVKVPDLAIRPTGADLTDRFLEEVARRRAAAKNPITNEDPVDYADFVERQQYLLSPEYRAEHAGRSVDEIMSTAGYGVYDEWADLSPEGKYSYGKSPSPESYPDFGVGPLASDLRREWEAFIKGKRTGDIPTLWDQFRTLVEQRALREQQWP